MGRLYSVRIRMIRTGQNLAQLNAPLVEAVDVPDSTLSEGDVLVVGNEGTQGTGSHLLDENVGGGAVAAEDLVWGEAGAGAFGLDLVEGLADHEGFGLGEEVGGQHARKRC